MSAGMDRVFEIGPIFRAEEHDTRRHLNEAISIDVEVSFADDEDVMVLLEEVMAKIYADVVENCQYDLDVLGVDLKVPKLPFRRVTYTEAIEMANENRETKLEWGDDLDTEAERPSEVLWMSITSSQSGQRRSSLTTLSQERIDPRSAAALT